MPNLDLTVTKIDLIQLTCRSKPIDLEFLEKEKASQLQHVFTRVCHNFGIALYTSDQYYRKTRATLADVDRSFVRRRECSFRQGRKRGKIIWSDARWMEDAAVLCAGRLQSPLPRNSRKVVRCIGLFVY